MKLPLSISIIISFASSKLITLDKLDYTVFDDTTSIGSSCKVKGGVQDTSCEYDTLDEVNERLHPLLESLVQRKFFRYYKVNLNGKKCMFWNRLDKCNREDCAVEELEDLVYFLVILCMNSLECYTSELGKCRQVH
jgi:hypothetical protein